jgi:hypothetical protein
MRRRVLPRRALTLGESRISNSSPLVQDPDSDFVIVVVVMNFDATFDDV